jgi:hypothetical protein
MKKTKPKTRPPRHESLNNELVTRQKAGGSHKNRKEKRTTKNQFDKEILDELK